MSELLNQGINMLLTSDEHCIGRLVDDVRFQIESNAVSGSHCKIYRKRAATEEVEPPSLLCMPVFFLKDTRFVYCFWNLSDALVFDR